jgi:hypothetical protein
MQVYHPAFERNLHREMKKEMEEEERVEYT